MRTAAAPAYGCATAYQTSPSNLLRVAARYRCTGCRTQRLTSVTTRPVLRSYHVWFSASVATPSWTDEIGAQILRLGLAALFLPQPDRAASSGLMMILASEPPMN
jgi:hypothetical protein